ncbi:MAG TPA: type II toxin-antitoxin system RelE/ParE family toxin [Pirellulales bacterium]|nr:type II toxin-antitoxin system RelE/ParE family toxin [Pirellulales bacterium]
MPRIIWSPTSRTDLAAIRAYIAKDAPRAADAFIRRLTRTVRRLKRFPMSGSVIAELGTTELREIYCGSYRIIHRVVDRKVEIVTVRHAARLLGPDFLP